MDFLVHRPKSYSASEPGEAASFPVAMMTSLIVIRHICTLYFLVSSVYTPKMATEVEVSLKVLACPHSQVSLCYSISDFNMCV